VDTKDDASQQAADTIYATVRHLSVQDSHSVASPSAVSNNDFSFANNVPCVLKPMDNVPTNIYEELNVSSTATAPPAHEYHEENVDENTIRYCLAVKIQARRQVTGSAAKRAEFRFVSSFESP
jgi:hypothetical protein